MAATPVILILSGRDNAPSAAEQTRIEQSRAEKADAVTRALAALEEFTRSHGGPDAREPSESVQRPIAAHTDEMAPAKDAAEQMSVEQAPHPR